MCLFFNISAATEAGLLHPRLSEGHKLPCAVTSTLLIVGGFYT